jgi:hypothetical protein
MSTVFTVAISDDLEVGFFAEGENAKVAKQDLEGLVEFLGDDINIELTMTGEVENHRDQARMQRVHELTHQGLADLAGHDHSHSH